MLIRKKNFYFSCVIFTLCFSSLVFAAKIKQDDRQEQWHITGVSEPLKHNIEQYLAFIPLLTHSQNLFALYKKKMLSQILEALKALGYYQPTIKSINLNHKTKQIDIDINPGLPVRFCKIDIKILGLDEQKPQLLQLMQNKKSNLTKGHVFDNGVYEDFKKQLLQKALSLGYLDAKWEKHQVLVDLNTHCAQVTLQLKPGHPYFFGEIIIKTPQKFIKLVQNLINFKTDDRYLDIKVNNLIRSIYNSNYFTNVRVYPLKDKISNYHIPLVVQVTPKKKSDVLLGLGYATDVGYRFSMNWNKALLNHYGHSLSTKLQLSSILRQLAVSYIIPVRNPLVSFYDFRSSYEEKKNKDIYSRLMSFSVNRWHKLSALQSDFLDQNLFIRVDNELYDQDAAKYSGFFILPGVSWSYRNLDQANNLNPAWGVHYLAKIEFSSKNWGSDENFVRLYGTAKWLHNFNTKNHFLIRFTQGAILFNSNVNSLSPSLRFFAGGDQSIRGYSYESIGPLDKAGNTEGGLYLTTASMEYTYSFNSSWSVAAFVDTGTATNTYKEDWKTGVGFGIGRSTPVGILKVYIGFALNEPGTPWRLHISIGPSI